LNLKIEENLTNSSIEISKGFSEFLKGAENFFGKIIKNNNIDKAIRVRKILLLSRIGRQLIVIFSQV
tara:strand:+ start:332 stop:532 length:201 start_codon:yes stop_codon:yes gene_type:complete